MAEAALKGVLRLQCNRQPADQIRNGGLRPGQRVTGRDLADLFRESRSPVRGALSAPAGAGVLTPGERGGFVI